MKTRMETAARAVLSAATFAVTALALPSVAHASFLPRELMDSAATYLAWFILIVMPVAGIVLFWLVHILPERFAEKRHHPQKDAIQMLCLLSLLFGCLLWPITWLWAFTKPASYRLAYGTDKHSDYFVHMSERAVAGELSEAELGYLHDEFKAIAARGSMTPELREARTKLEQVVPAVAYTMEEHHHGQGVAGRLFAALNGIARMHGISRFEADVLAGNAGTLRAFERIGRPLRRRCKAGVIHVCLDLGPGSTRCPMAR
jgi:hypothetical protein